MSGLLIALAVLLLVVWMPVGCEAIYDGTPEIKLRLGPFRFRLYPPGKKQRTPRSKKLKKQRSDTPTVQQQQFSVSQMKALLPLIQTALRTLGCLRRALAVRQLTLHVTCGADDPADRALRYGQAWSVIGVLVPMLEQAFRIKKRDVQAYYDPDASDLSIFACLKMRLFVWQIITIAISAGWKFFTRFLKLKKGGANQ